MGWLLTGSFVALLIAAMATDLRSGRIPNVLVLAGLGAALGLRAWMGWAELGSGALGAAVALAITFPLFALGAFGAGDAKLMAAVGAFMGPRELLPAMLATALVGGVLGLVVAARTGALRRVLMKAGDVLAKSLTGGRPSEPERVSPTTIPYAVPIALGSLLIWFT